MEQGSYMLIRRGMTVRGTEGDLGTVDELVADEGADIFRGIVLAQGVLLPKRSFISADHILSVEQNVVQVDLSKRDADHLPPPMIERTVSQGKDVI